jgi:hypothetical protein
MSEIMEGMVVIVIGSIAVILALAGLALLAVWLQNRISGRKSLPPGCVGEPTLERCRTCRYMQGYGNDTYCSILSRQIAQAENGSDQVSETSTKDP